jgi:hypothetical protein
MGVASAGRISNGRVSFPAGRDGLTLENNIQRRPRISDGKNRPCGYVNIGAVNATLFLKADQPPSCPSPNSKSGFGGGSSVITVYIHARNLKTFRVFETLKV